jgi:hypothetical protein
MGTPTSDRGGRGLNVIVHTLMRVARLTVNVAASLLLVATTTLPVAEIGDLLDDSSAEDGFGEAPSGSASGPPRAPRPLFERHGRVLLSEDTLPVACVVVVPAVVPSLTDVRDSRVRLPPRPRQKPRSVRVTGKDLERGPPPAA